MYIIAESLAKLLVLKLLIITSVLCNPILNTTTTGHKPLSKGLGHVPLPKGLGRVPLSKGLGHVPLSNGHIDRKTTKTTTINAHDDVINNGSSLLATIVGGRSDSIGDATDKLQHREGRGVPCGPSPPGVDEPCVVCSGEPEVTITDENGYKCPCQVCEPATFMAEKCQCTEDGQMKSQPTCVIPDVGVGYIDVTNFCPKPYPCSECRGDLISKPSSCSGFDDTKCICPEDTYRTGDQSCMSLPLCDVNHERRLVQPIDSPYLSYECLPCSDDSYQPQNNSAELCQPRPRPTTPTLSPQDDKTTIAPFITPISPECPTPVCNCPTTPSLEGSTLRDLCTAAVGQIYKKCDSSTVLWIVIVSLMCLLLPLGFGLGHFGRKSGQSCFVCRCAKSVWDLMKNFCRCLFQRGTYKVASLEEPSLAMDNRSSNQPVSQSDNRSTSPHRNTKSSGGAKTKATKGKKTQR